MAHIDYYFSTISPYTYLAGDRLEGVAEKHGASVTYKPLDILGLFSRTGGTPPKDRHPSRQVWRLQELTRQARKLDMSFNLKPAHWPTNQAPSAYAVIAAQSAGGGDLAKLIRAILRSVWADEKDVAESDVVRACLKEAGFDPALADTGMLEAAETYARNLDEAVAANVFGAPTFVTDTGQNFWGQDRIEDLDLHLAGKI
ncbi:MAG: 2-hydroxychromene-2-carboxylate isomerase [Pseudomonadota bacterium]